MVKLILPMRQTLFLAVIFVLSACHSKSKQSSSAEPVYKTIPNEYATGFKVEETNGGYVLTIAHPSDHSKVFQTFAVYKDKPLNRNPKIDIQVKIPLHRVAALATNHIGFMDALNKTNSIIGITDPFRVYNSKVKASIKSGEIANLGESMTPNNEMIMANRPDVLLKSGFPNTRANDKVLREAGIPIVYTVAWTEKTPLARAEWIKFFGILYNEQKMADSIFKAVKLNYLKLKEASSLTEHKPLVFCGNSFKGVWYIPGGNSYIANFINDAGGRYVFANDTTTGSMSVSFEVVYTKARDADIWLNVQEISLSEMMQNDSRFGAFKPVQNREVYSRKGRWSANGENDYFETGTWRPDIVLNDLIHILHHQNADSAFVFYKRLAE